MRSGKRAICFRALSENEFSYIIYLKTERWFFKEIITTLLFLYVWLFKVKKRKIKCYNFHIAYPLLTYAKWFHFLTKKKFFVTEHWSAYHYNFGQITPPKRIKNLFKLKKLNVIAVSKSLSKDLNVFSSQIINSKILFNTVDENLFFLNRKVSNQPSFFMLSYWKSPKNPFIIIEAFHQLKENHNLNFSIRIAGEGPLLIEMKQMVSDYNLKETVTFLGTLSSKEIAEEMNSTTYFLHNSDYETFSVVCAEALMCGTPVIASNVGAIPEYLTAEMGVLVNENSVESWKKVILQSLEDKSLFNNQNIASKAKTIFSKEIIGKKYYSILNDEN